MKISCIGHRILMYEPAIYEMVHAKFCNMMIEMNPEVVITGMAVGFGFLVAEACWKLKIPFIVAIAFDGQEDKWQEFQKTRYKTLLTYAKEVVMVSPGGYDPEKYQIRNEWMVNNCDEIIAYFDHRATGGSTKNCLDYAVSQNKKITYIDVFYNKDFQKISEREAWKRQQQFNERNPVIKYGQDNK